MILMSSSTERKLLTTWSSAIKPETDHATTARGDILLWPVYMKERGKHH